MADIGSDPKKPIPDDGKVVRKHSVAGEEDPGSSVGVSTDSSDQPPPPAHADKRVHERESATGRDSDEAGAAPKK